MKEFLPKTEDLLVIPAGIAFLLILLIGALLGGGEHDSGATKLRKKEGQLEKKEEKLKSLEEKLKRSH